MYAGRRSLAEAALFAGTVTVIVACPRVDDCVEGRDPECVDVPPPPHALSVNARSVTAHHRAYALIVGAFLECLLA